MTLLIVAAHEQLRLVIKAVMRDLTEAIYECLDEAEALAVYRERQPDWVLFDLKTPRGDSIAAARELKTVFPGAKVAMLTDYDDADLCSATRHAGARAYVLKEDLLALRTLLTQT